MTIKLEIKDLSGNLLEKKTRIKQTICLNMIVKDEADIIKNTLENVCSKINIDYYVICDTGSTDTTKEIITNFFKEKDISGELHDIPWKDFGYNRSKALELAYKKTDFLLHFDADDRIRGNLVLPTPLEKGAGYKMNFGSSVHWRRMPLVCNHIKWYYEGVMHELITTKEKFKGREITGDYFIDTNVEVSARNKNPTEKFLKDAQILEEAFKKKDNLHKRYAFYCAECYRFAGKWEKSIEWYKKTISLGGWHQERYWSCFQMGNLYANHKEPEKAFYWYCMSYDFDTSRHETFFQIINKFRLTGKHKLGMTYYKMLKPLKDINSKLFLVNHVHDYSLDIEVTISGYYANEHQLAIDAFKRLFNNGRKVPKHLIRLTISNLRFYVPKINKNDDKFYEGFCKFLEICKEKKEIVPENLKTQIEKLFNNNNRSYFIK